MIAGLGSAALAYFLMIDATFGLRQDSCAAAWSAETSGGRSVARWRRRCLGRACVAALSLTLYLTQVSLKKVIGLLLIVCAGCAPAEMPKFKLSLPEGHTSLREAFALPKGEPRAAEAAQVRKGPSRGLRR